MPQSVIEVPTVPPVNTEADVFADYPRDEFEDNQPFYAELVQQVDPSQVPVVIGKPKERRFAAIHPESILGEGVCGWILEGDGEGKKDDQKSNKPRRPDCRVATSMRNKTRVCAGVFDSTPGWITMASTVCGWSSRKTDAAKFTCIPKALWSV
jgi:hypothetical protein